MDYSFFSGKFNLKRRKYSSDRNNEVIEFFLDNSIHCKVSKPQISSKQMKYKRRKYDSVNRKRSPRSSSSCTIFATAIIIYSFITNTIRINNSLLLVSAEDFDRNNNNDYDLDGSSRQGSTSAGEDWNDDNNMDFIFSSFFGFCITLFGTMVGYFSMKEDKLMQKYLKDGYRVNATIESSEILQKRSMWHHPDNHQQHNEKSNSLCKYQVRCDYVDILTDDYKVRVQKIFKVRQSDIIPSSYENQLINTAFNNSNSQVNITNIIESEAEYQGSLLDKSDDAVIVNIGSGNSNSLIDNNDLDAETASGPIVGLTQNHFTPIIHNSINHSQPQHQTVLDMKKFTLELRVLKGFPKSGYPKKLLERTCGLRYRLMTVGLTLCTFIMATFCVFSAVRSKIAISQQKNSIDDQDIPKLGWYYGIGIFSLYGILEALFIYCFFDSIMDQVLHDEYLLSGEFVPLLRYGNHNFDDDSTISTVKGDAFLALTRPIKLDDVVSMLSFGTVTS